MFIDRVLSSVSGLPELKKGNLVVVLDPEHISEGSMSVFQADRATLSRSGMLETGLNGVLNILGRTGYWSHQLDTSFSRMAELILNGTQEPRERNMK